jgi:hypothetical protein
LDRKLSTFVSFSNRLVDINNTGGSACALGLLESTAEKMNLGKQIRLNRIFSPPTRRLCSVAIDHFIGYGRLLPKSGLSCLPEAHIDGRLGAHETLPEENVLRSARVLFLDQYGIPGNLRVARIARGAGIATVADFEDDTHPQFGELLALLDPAHL